MKTTKIRYFAVAQLKTLGPSNKVRGSFLVEFTGERVGTARVWNAAHKKWTQRVVDLHNAVECADYRLAHHGDLAKFGCNYAGPIG